MSCPSILGLGPYKPGLPLPYPEVQYSDVKEGAFVAGAVAGWDVRAQGQEFLELFGLTYAAAWPGIELPEVTEEIVDHARWADFSSLRNNEVVETLEELRTLQQNGWKLFYEPDE